MLTISKYQTGQLADLLGDLQSERVSGSVYINTTKEFAKKPRSYVLVFQNGEIIYGGLKVPNNNQDLARTIGIKLHYSWAEAAIKYTAQKLNNPSSFRELLERIVGIRVFKWAEIESTIQAQVVQILEQILPQPGELRLDSLVPFDLSYGEDCHNLDWSKLWHELTLRQEEWAAISDSVPSIEAIPKLLVSNLQAITDSKAKEHLGQWVDGVRSLIDIAQELDEDPLDLARFYMKWALSGWITLAKETPKNVDIFVTPKQLPVVLSVDDSIIVQTMIKRTLCEHYQVLLASNAVDALKVINSSPIALLLLDVTMPGIDGLEFCRTVRSIDKFKNLPIIMITARDKFSDKLRGQIAGATHYLIKPIEPKKLNEIVDQSLANVQK